MDFDKENNLSSENDHSCGCGCGCSENHNNEDGCCGDHDHDGCGCGCGCGHENRYLTLVLEDDTKLECQVIGIFESDEHAYIALLHPTEETALLFRYYTDGQNIDIENIEEDAEYEKASKLFMSLYE